jgi:hypothetical protein
MSESSQHVAATGRSGSSGLPIHRKILFLLALLLGLCVICEVLLWAVGYEPRVMQPATPKRNLTDEISFKTSNPDIPYLRAPHSSFTERWPSDPRGYFDGETHGLTYRVNNAGFRGGDFVKERTDAVRVAFLGDSFCWGVGVRDEDHFITRTGELLAKQAPFQERFELLNFGLEGFNTVQEVALFKQIVLEYEPDVAVIWYFLNDWESQGALAGTKRYLRGNSLLRGPRKYSCLLDLIVTPIDLRRSTQRMIEIYRSGYEQDSPGWRAAHDALEEFATLCHELGIVPVLAIHPVLIRLDDSYPFADIHDSVFEAATAAGIHAVDLFDAFAGRDARELWVHLMDQHPNEIAHGLAAEYFTGFLRTVLEREAQTIHRHMDRASRTTTN